VRRPAPNAFRLPLSWFTSRVEGGTAKLGTNTSIMRLKIQIPKSWAAQENPNGPATFCRHLSHIPGPLQVSWAEYSHGSIPNPSVAGLAAHGCRVLGRRMVAGIYLSQEAVQCVFGSMGTAIFRSSQHPRIQLWFLSNGRDFINVTHICRRSQTR